MPIFSHELELHTTVYHMPRYCTSLQERVEATYKREHGRIANPIVRGRLVKSPA
jgi:hypothetical protein